jgi:glucose/arabinose dehydrogenase
MLPVSAVRHAGAVVVAEHGKGRVVAIGPEGQTVLASGLPAPTGLAQRGGDLFVSDRERGQILHIAQAGQPVDPPAVVAAGFSSPEGIAATQDGFLVVEGETGRLLEVGADGETRLLATTAPGSPAPTASQPPSMIFNGVVLAGDGVAFATGETSRTLYRVDTRAAAR